MYILFEKSSSHGGNNLYEFDCMGFATSEKDAMTWVHNNSEYRTYKYCPDTKFPEKMKMKHVPIPTNFDFSENTTSPSMYKKAYTHRFVVYRFSKECQKFLSEELLDKPLNDIFEAVRNGGIIGITSYAQIIDATDTSEEANEAKKTSDLIERDDIVMIYDKMNQSWL